MGHESKVSDQLVPRDPKHSARWIAIMGYEFKVSDQLVPRDPEQSARKRYVN
jgi:hypothetical protein